MLKLESQLRKKTGALILKHKGYFCPICTRKFVLEKDRTHILSLWQRSTGKRNFVFHLSFICPDCITYCHLEYSTFDDSTELIKYMKIYNDKEEAIQATQSSTVKVIYEEKK